MEKALAINIHMSELQTMQQEIYDYVKTNLGDGMIDVELDPKHYQTALERAINRYRQRSSNAVEESYAFLDLKENQNKYILPDEIINVREISRATVGSRGDGQGGTLFEPFNLAYTNTYLLSSTNMGGLLTYELFAGYQERIGKMFGSFIQFTWIPQSHKLTIHQRPRAREEIMLWVYNVRPDSALINDTYAGQWIKDYALANCKMMLGQAREKFGQIAGPQGGTQLNGAALKQEAAADIERLTAELVTQVTGGPGYSFVIG
jgi:hypothetical protein